MNWLRLSPLTKFLGRTFTANSVASQPIKHKIPRKRASKLLGELRVEECARVKNGRNYPDIRAGDSIMIEKLPYMSSKQVDVIKGVVLAKTNRLADSSLRILNMEFGTPVERLLFMYSPLIKNITVLQKAFIHKGKKRVRRSKVYYIRNLHPDTYTVK